MKMTAQQKFNHTKTALAVGVALFAVSELAMAVYTPRTSELTGTADAIEVDNTEPVTIDVLANDGNVNVASLAIGSAPAQGTIAVVDGKIVYTPNEDFVGTDTFSYTVQENEWRNAASEIYSDMQVNIMPPIASSYTAEDGSAIPIRDGENPVGLWNEQPSGNGVIGKSWMPNTSVTQLQGCNAGDETATPISLKMTWIGERRGTNDVNKYNPGGNQFTITTDAAPTPVQANANGIVLQVFQDTSANITSSPDGATGSITDNAGSVSNGMDSWKFTAVANWPNLSAAQFEAMPITILASTYNEKTWRNASTSFEATVDHSTCQLNSATVNVSVTKIEKEKTSSGGGGSISTVVMFALGLFGLNALRRRRQA